MPNPGQFISGDKRTNLRGRPPGPNKNTLLAREAIARLVENNVPKMEGWLNSIAEEHGPLVAWKCVNEVLEYHIPRLARTELTGENGGPIVLQLQELDRRA